MGLDFDRLMASVQDDASAELELEKGGASQPVAEIVPKVNTDEIAKQQEAESLRLAEETAKANTEAEMEKQPEPEVDPNPGITYKRKVTHTDTRAQTVGRKSTKATSTCEIRSFPKSLLTMVKETLGGGVTIPNTKALAAFVYANRDPDLDIDYSDVPDDVIELAASFDKYKTMMSMDRRVRVIEASLRRLNLVADDIALGQAYLIFDRAGFNERLPNRPSDINFAQPGIEEVINNIGDTNDAMRKEKAIKEGRPIK